MDPNELTSALRYADYLVELDAPIDAMAFLWDWHLGKLDNDDSFFDHCRSAIVTSEGE